jgi:hypothetical protein
MTEPDTLRAMIGVLIFGGSGVLWAALAVFGAMRTLYAQRGRFYRTVGDIRAWWLQAYRRVREKFLRPIPTGVTIEATAAMATAVALEARGEATFEDVPAGLTLDARVSRLEAQIRVENSNRNGEARAVQEQIKAVKRSIEALRSETGVQITEAEAKLVEKLEEQGRDGLALTIIGAIGVFVSTLGGFVFAVIEAAA